MNLNRKQKKLSPVHHNNSLKTRKNVNKRKGYIRGLKGKQN